MPHRKNKPKEDNSTEYNITNRKKEHIELADKAQVFVHDNRFHYEPMMASHLPSKITNFEIAGKRLKTPIWVSSMTGGTESAGLINKNLATACNEFGMGMGLGSCRALIDDDAHFEDFNVRSYIGDSMPLFANLGIAQVEHLLENRQIDKIKLMVDRLRADGLIIHVNPLQEWLQPEGNLISNPPIETIERILELVRFPVIVKEVGQGMGPESLKHLLQLPLEAVEFGAFGGTNFSQLELLRNTPGLTETFQRLSFVGEKPEEMVEYVNQLIEKNIPLKTNNLIISGGVSNFLDGYFLVHSSKMDAIYGHAYEFLKYAKGDYSELQRFIEAQINGYRLAFNYLTIRVK